MWQFCIAWGLLCKEEQRVASELLCWFACEHVTAAAVGCQVPKIPAQCRSAVLCCAVAMLQHHLTADLCYVLAVWYSVCHAHLWCRGRCVCIRGHPWLGICTGLLVT